MHSGHREDARRVVADLAPVVCCITPAPILRVHLVHARAILAREADAEQFYPAALDQDLSR